MVPVNEHGEVEFDMLAESVFEAVYVDFGNAANDQNLGRDRACFPGWRTPPIPVSIDNGPPDAAFRGGVKGESFKDFKHVMKWSAPADWSGNYVVEAARGEGDEEWQPAHVVESAKTEWDGFEIWNVFPFYTGPLKLRVVPASPTPP